MTTAMKRQAQQGQDQSVFDVCLEQYGSLDGLAVLAAQNGTLHDQSGWLKLVATMRVEVTNDYKPQVVAHYKRQGIKPASLQLGDEPNALDPLTDDFNTPLTDDDNSILF